MPKSDIFCTNIDIFSLKKCVQLLSLKISIVSDTQEEGMRLGLLIRDIEYRNALVERLTNYDNDIFVNVIDGKSGDASGCLLLTDLRPDQLEQDVLSKLRCRTVFLTESAGFEDMSQDGRSCGDHCHCIFKYCSVSSLISELSVIYSEWKGEGPVGSFSAKIIAVCSESDSFSSVKCMTLARQIIYQHGGRVLTASLGYLNDYGSTETAKMNRFARLMYEIKTGNQRRSDSFTLVDSYGVSSLMLPPGQNPMAYLDEDELKTLIAGLASRFDTLVLDIGTCFRRENLSIMKSCENIVCFESGRRELGLDRMLGSEKADSIIRIRLSEGSEEALAIDDCIRRIYGGRQ